jgi:hypothetical protein
MERRTNPDPLGHILETHSGSVNSGSDRSKGEHMAATSNGSRCSGPAAETDRDANGGAAYHEAGHAVMAVEVYGYGRLQQVWLEDTYKWLARFHSEGRSGLADRSSRPLRCPRRIPRALVRRIERLRC